MTEPNPVSTTNPTSAGNSDAVAELEKLKQEKAELERAAKGLKTDLLSEREKRQQLQQELASRSPSPAGAGPANGGVDPVQELIAKAAMPLVEGRISYEKAKNFVARKANVDPDEVESSEVWKELLQTAEKNNIVGKTAYDTAKLTWEVMEARKKTSEEVRLKAEEDRKRNIAGNSSTSSTAAPTGTAGAKTITEAELAALPINPQTAEIVKQIKSGQLQLVRA